MHANNSVHADQHGANKPGLSTHAERRLRDAVRRRSPSEPWVDAQFKEVPGADDRGLPVTRYIHDPSVFPPGGAATAMVRCTVCGIFMPPMTIEGGVCLDHSDHENWGRSPSAAAIQSLQYRQLRINESELAPESTEALLKEIRDCLKGKWKGEKNIDE